METYPEMTFKSTSLEKKGKGWVLNGDLTMKGVTKPVSIPFEITGFIPGGERSGAKIGIAGETTINRRDFGVNYGVNMANGVPTVSDTVKVVLQIRLERRQRLTVHSRRALVRPDPLVRLPHQALRYGKRLLR